VTEDAQDALARYEAEIEERDGPGATFILERDVLLDSIDVMWRNHLYEMDYLATGIGLRALANRNPFIEYQSEGFDMLECTAYSDSHTDLPFLEAVGNPVAVNPDRELRRIARDRGWPVLEFNGRAYPHARRRIPPAFVAAGVAGAAAILATRSRGR